MADKLDPITLGKTQEIESIYVDVADNGGIIVSWTVHTPSKSRRESGWKSHKEVFDKIEDALSRIKELYTAEINRKVANKKSA